MRPWRRSDPRLTEQRRQQQLASDLMKARRDVGSDLRTGDAQAEREARCRMGAAKMALGERGPIWWTDDAPDLNRRLVRDTPYAVWFAGLADDG